MSVVSVGCEQIFRCVHMETERQENLDIRTFSQNTFVDVSGILQLIDADRISTLLVTSGIQWVQYLCSHIST